MIEVGRRGFITGLAALVAAPAVIRVATLMPISSRFTPLYVPPRWLLPSIDLVHSSILDLKSHAWPRRLDDTWININDYDPAYVEQLVERLDREDQWGIWA